MDDRDRAATAADQTPGRTRAQWTLAGIVLALGLGAAAYRVLQWREIDETAALFVGLPTILAVALALTPKAKSATGMILKGMTIALLLSAPLLGEGFVCILMASPLFYGVGALVGVAFDHDREHGGGPARSFVLVPLLLMSMEGISPSLSFPTELSASAAKTVGAPAVAVEAQLAAPPRFVEELPPFLRLGFPRPRGAEGAGLAIGDTRTVFYGRGAQPKTLVFRVAERAPGYVRFEAVHDDTKIGTWLTWHDAEVRWSERPDGTTDVAWQLRFSRRLSPGWYFAPLETWGAAAAAEHLIDSLATPRDG